MPAPRPIAVPPWSRPFLRPLAHLYGLVVRARAGAYRSGWLATRALPCRVISVGNLTVGGTGKTPLVIWIVHRLLAAGRRVAVLSRGYGRRGRGHVLVSDGAGLLVPAEAAGDEPALIAEACPGAVVAVGPDRYELGRWVLQRFPIDCCVLDDGFQHLSLAREVNLLLADASDPEGLEALLPAGRLREPLQAAGRATAVLLTRSEREREPVWEALRPHVPALSEPIRVRFEGDGLREIGSSKVLRLVEAAGRTAVIFSGVAHPRSFRRLLERAGIVPADEVIFPDHHAYVAADLVEVRQRAARRQADLIVTTAKDAVKVKPLLQAGDRVYALQLRTEIAEGRARLERLILGRDGHE